MGAAEQIHWLDAYASAHVQVLAGPARPKDPESTSERSSDDPHDLAC